MTLALLLTDHVQQLPCGGTTFDGVGTGAGVRRLGRFCFSSMAVSVTVACAAARATFLRSTSDGAASIGSRRLVQRQLSREFRSPVQARAAGWASSVTSLLSTACRAISTSPAAAVILRAVARPSGGLGRRPGYSAGADE